jgi:hypothetical protein
MNKKTIIGIGLLMLLLIAVKVYADTFLISINNQSTSIIGAVRLNLTSSSYVDETIGGYGSYGPYGEPSLISITINGQTVGRGVNATVHLVDNTPIAMSWSENGGNITIVMQPGM